MVVDGAGEGTFALRSGVRPDQLLVQALGLDLAAPPLALATRLAAAIEADGAATVAALLALDPGAEPAAVAAALSSDQHVESEHPAVEAASFAKRLYDGARVAAAFDLPLRWSFA